MNEKTLKKQLLDSKNALAELQDHSLKQEQEILRLKTELHAQVETVRSFELTKKHFDANFQAEKEALEHTHLSRLAEKDKVMQEVQIQAENLRFQNSQLKKQLREREEFVQDLEGKLK